MCFSVLFFVTLLIEVIVLVAVVMILRLLIPWLLSLLGVNAGPLMQIVNIIIAVIVIIAVIWLMYDLLTCAWSLRLGRY